MRPPPVKPSLLALLALVGLACKAKIGDECLRSTDCSLQGERICDLSHRVDPRGVVTPGGKGECTIDGCGLGSCPKEAACIKVYGSDFLSIACDPAREDLAVACDPDEEGEAICEARGCVPSTEPSVWTCPPRNDCDPNEVCLPEGLCADEVTARTSCRRKCSNDRDCREGYECRETGSGGVYRAPNLDDPQDLGTVRICMPVG
ncbi:hypothetical protein [Paraliomyxa miuraensis]|uniref:hypothetical protein n=1 Tax=Paraliomyxa miuraensis TaxID=376150 RepID=UPI002252E8B5|nr:hypothetical protein [Paraliomyxa miuraensis]MCX4244165.1 hypothetical protein [Paraliomyxa miuraensis]